MAIGPILANLLAQSLPQAEPLAAPSGSSNSALLDDLWRLVKFTEQPKPPPMNWAPYFKIGGTFLGAVGAGLTIYSTVNLIRDNFERQRQREANLNYYRHERNLLRVQQCVDNGHLITGCWAKMPDVYVTDPLSYQAKLEASAIWFNPLNIGFGDFLEDAIIRFNPTLKKNEHIDNIQTAEEFKAEMDKWQQEWLEKIRRQQNGDLNQIQDTLLEVNNTRIEKRHTKLPEFKATAEPLPVPSPSLDVANSNEEDPNTDRELRDLEKTAIALDKIFRGMKVSNIQLDAKRTQLLASLAILKDENISLRIVRISKEISEFLTELNHYLTGEIIIRNNELTNLGTLIKIEVLSPDELESVRTRVISTIEQLMSHIQLLTQIHEELRQIVEINNQQFNSLIHDLNNQLAPLVHALERIHNNEYLISCAEVHPVVGDRSTARKLIEAVVVTWSSRALDQQVHLSIEGKDDLRIPRRLQGPIFNILCEAVLNGIKYKDIRKLTNTVTISFSVAKNNLIITVRDNGVGMSRDQVDRTLLGGHRYHTEVDGTGRGISDTIVRTSKDNGIIHHLDSEIDKGTTHTFKIDTSKW